MKCDPTDNRSKPGLLAAAQPNAGLSPADQPNAALSFTSDDQTCFEIDDADFVSSNRFRDSTGAYLRDSTGAYLGSSA